MGKSHTVIFDGGKNKGGTYYSFLIFQGRTPIRFDNRIKINANTSNEAEYIALIRALEALLEMDADSILILGDSRLVVNQVNGAWKVTAKNLRPLNQKAKSLFGKLKNALLVWWPDDQSKHFLGH